MISAKNERIDELTKSLIIQLRHCREVFELGQEFEIAKHVKERIKSIEKQLDELLQLQATKKQL